MNKKLIFIVIAAALSLGVVWWQYPQLQNTYKNIEILQEPVIPVQVKTNTQSNNNEPVYKEIPSRKVLNNNYHIFQTFNNCGPAAMSMALSYYGINVTQQELGEQLRPYQNPQGDNDDKSVTLEEVAKKAEEYDLLAYRRPNGNIDIIKLFIANDIPVIARTWLKVDDDIGHYRIIKGYDDSRGELVQDDSLQGKNLWYKYDDFNAIWKKFNFEYLVLVPKEKEQIAQEILGDDAEFEKSWERAVENIQKELNQNSTDTDMRFNLSVALYNIGEYEKSVEEFEKVETSLSKRTLWYQIEPIKSYYELNDYERVFEITDNILNNGNKAFSELYVLRGDIYKKQGNIEAAREEYEKAVFYNKNLKEAHNALNSIN